MWLPFALVGWVLAGQLTEDEAEDVAMLLEGKLPSNGPAGGFYDILAAIHAAKEESAQSI